MGRLFVPAENSIEGPWLLGNEELEQLDELVKRITINLEEAYKKKQNNPDDLFPVPVIVNAVLTSKDNKKLEDSSVKEILQDVKVKDFLPTELHIKIQNVPSENEFELLITAGYEGKLEYKLKCFNEKDESSIKYELEKWIKKHEPKLIVKYWLSCTPIIWIIGLIAILSMWSGLYDTSTDYETYLNNEAKKLIKNGIDSSNINEVINILLQKEIKYTPENFKVVETLNQESLRNFFRVILVFIILILCPRSVIGIGKSNWKYIFGKWCLKLTLVFIPISILLPRIIDVINKLF